MDISKLDKKINPSGTMVISNKSRALKLQGKPVIGFGAGEPDFPSPKYVVDAAIKAVSDPKNHKYSPAAGLQSLREVIAKTTKDYSGFEISSDNVIVTNGGKQAILTAFFSTLDSGDEVIIPAPYWTTYPEAVKIAGGTPVFIQTEKSNNFKVTVEQLEKSKTDNTKMVVWCSPSNPTGVVYTKEEAEEIYEWIFKNDIWILSDELYEHLVYEGEKSPSPAIYDPEFKNTIIVNGVSKSYSMTGWRVGWLLGNNNVIGLGKKIQSQATSNVSNVSQLAAEAALLNGLEVTNEMKIAFNRRRLFATEKINSIPNLNVVESTGAFYLFVDVSYYCTEENGLRTSEELCDWLLENYYIAFVPGEVFGTPGFMRLSYALSDEDLDSGLSRLSEAIDNLNE
ncbi:MAG: pyridoxal phosphate-dependent aminotransferase [Candidatus Actinomarina sp.]|jgi:aspartate/methionine/tyrosine aminotransferase|nr:pyridoxal phosphate-dependent aminotransferase [Candidatus Actinomarina sp.]MBL6762932.1 pyridoxal phosphate-dependent aminotransferase [Candidatus Actinomarina sp.]MDA2946936.1 pyridoxal phosphate-dependent aminotransferase [Actinomycetota bacterium]MDA3008949.1 pyridoxal phosphate-dependent aminotransferase [Actinomycetota bacterium]MDA3037848.1 pyridoxal phosphate-dependent aminotransferase [Actinomycetota bacterium]